MSSLRLTQHVDAPRAAVYRALVDAGARASWMVPDGMTSVVHAFDAREGGAYRISLTYAAPDLNDAKGKSSAHTDTFHGRFATLVPDQRVVEEVEFETSDPAMQGVMTIAYELRDADGGTDVIASHDGVPAGVPAEDNELGWRMSLGKLAALVEASVA